MLNSITRSALVAFAALTGFSALGAAPAAAGAVRVVLEDGVRAEPVQYRDYDRRHGGRGDSCSPRLAVRKAYDMGANRPRVVRENRRVVVVDGVRRGRLITMRFANERGCPVLAVRR